MGLYLNNVVTLQLDQDLCVGCARCLEVCPHRVFSMKDNKAWLQDRDACMECGACAKNCPKDAITVQAGVGCAQAVFNSWRTGKTECCCDASCCGGTKKDKE
ncbi:MAG: 4Fe-4S binding protein [Phycisphaerae bacterium]|nr:4Fe-4S binding protein [Phycisphaerae bacterium]